MNRDLKLLKIFASLVSAAALFICFSCSSSSAFEKKPEIHSGQEGQEENRELWLAICSTDDLRGCWRSAAGHKIDYPLKLNGKTFLRFAYPELDDTFMWQACATRHNTSLADLWNKRFSYIGEVYGVNFPYTDDESNEFGIKLSVRNGRIIGRKEVLLSDKTIKKNLVNFKVSKYLGSLYFNGKFYYSDTKTEYFEEWDAVYEPYSDYWD